MSGDAELEHRYLIDRARAGEVLQLAGDHLQVEVYDPRLPVAYARTTYLDTPDDAFLRSHRTGVAARVRLRQYAGAAALGAEPVATSGAYLELKRSAGAARDKIRLPLEVDAAAALVAGRPTDATLRALADQPGLAELADALAVGQLAPRVTTWYRRLSLVGDGVRVTFDEAIAYCQPDAPRAVGALAEPGVVIARERRTVLEVKLRRAAPTWLARALGELVADRHHSKFRAAMAASQASQVPRLGATMPLPVLA